MPLLASGDGGICCFFIAVVGVIWLLMMVYCPGTVKQISNHIAEWELERKRQQFERERMQHERDMQNRQRNKVLFGVGGALLKVFLGHHHRHH